MSLQAYNKTIQSTEDSRSMEYRLFAQITGDMMSAAKSGQVDAPLADAIGRNRQLWQALAMDCRKPENQLPEQLRASIISLSIWVHKHTKLVMSKEENVQDLIDINRTIKQGLQPPSAPAERCCRSVQVKSPCL